jgi:Domain of unknown function (DUF5011)
MDSVDGSGNTLTGTYASTGSFQSTGSVNTFTLGTYTISYTKVDATGNTATATRTIIVSPYVQPVSTGAGGGVSYTPASNTPTVVSTTGALNSAPIITQSGTTIAERPVMSSRFKRKILRALLMNRALQRSRSENSISLTTSVDMASAPVLEIGLLEVSQPRVNIRLAPTTDSRIIGELKR